MRVSKYVMAIVFATVALLNSIFAAPPTPPNARPAWVDDFSVVLTWDDVPEATAFWVYRYDSSSAQWVTAESDVLVPMFREVPPHQPPLQYAITALNAEGESSAVIVSIDTTGFPGTMITAPPPGLNPGTLSETNAIISFWASIISGTDGLLEIGTSPNALEYYEYQPDYEGGHNFTVTNLLPGTEYFYRLTITETSRLGFSYMNSFVTYPMNQPPVAQDVTVQQIGEWEAAITVSGSDPDSGQILTMRITTDPTKGTIGAIAQFSPGSWTVYYQPNQHERGTDTFQFVVSDGQLESAPATVTITDIFMNEPPVVTDSQVSTPEDTAVAVILQAGDADGDALTYGVDYLSEGTLSGTAPNLTWTPPANFNGVAWLSFHVTDGAETAFGTVQFAVSPVNDAPVAYGQTYTIHEDIWRTVTLSATDVENDPITFEIVSMPTHGTLTGSGTTRTYQPDTNYFGTDSFRYRAFDGQAYSAPVTVSIVIFGVDDRPVAINQSLTVGEDNSLVGLLTASDPDGGINEFTIESFPQHGTLTGSGANFVYTPNANYHGPDSFDFRVSGFVGASFGRIDINVIPVNDAPIANGTSVNTGYNTPVAFALTGSDVEGSALSFIVVTTPANGTLSGTAPNLTFTPSIGWSGTTSFTFRVNDGALESTLATVELTVAPAAATPNAPSVLTAAAVSNSQIDLAWNDNSNDEDGFKIERSSNNTWTQIGTVGPNVRTFSSTGLNSNRNYSYRVRAFNMRGNSAYSNTASAKTLR